MQKLSEDFDELWVVKEQKRVETEGQNSYIVYKTNMEIEHNGR